MNAMKRGGEECDDVELGGVNHCSVHCRLAKFRGLKSRGKYGAVIGPKAPVTHCRLAKFCGLKSRVKHGAVIGPKALVTHCRSHCPRSPSHTVDLGLDTLSPTLVVFEMLAPNGQSQRRISPFSSDHGISPNDSVNYSG